MSTEDPLVELENLESPLTRQVIEEFNTETDLMLSGEVGKHHARLLELYSVPRATSAVLTKRGIVVLYRGKSEEVSLIRADGARERLLVSDEKEVFTYLSRVHGSDRLVAVRSSFEGRDYGKTYILDAESGDILYTVEGLVGNFFLVDGSLLYVRSYRHESPPDGARPPTDRLVKLADHEEEVVWGVDIVGTGEYIGRIVSSKDFRHLVLTVHKGWLHTRLYAVERDSWKSEAIEEGNYAIRLAGWLEGPVYLRSMEERDELVVQDKVMSMERPVEDLLVSDEKVMVVDIVDSAHRLRVLDLKEDTWREIQLPVKYSSLSIQDESHGEFLVLASSPSHRHLLATIRGGEVAVWEENVALPGLEVQDLWLRSFDGVKVHGFYMTLTRKPKAILIYGYGGFGVSITPSYSPFFQHLLEQGYGIAVVNARGGREEGESWHRSGMLKKKENTFLDIATFARFFKNLGMKVAAQGSSNGGLTVATVATRWPELLDVALIGYPVLDMLRYHLLYVGRYWVPEYGDPEDPEMHEFLKRYSPYHNIPVDKKLPPTLIFTGLNDDRVHPAHAIKFAKKARDLGHPVHLKVETRSGHSGAKSDVKALEQAYLSAFLEKVVGSSSG